MSLDFFNFLKEECSIDFNEKQKEAILHKNGPVLVLASPGSGKTTVLNAHIAYLIFRYRINPANILALTFSKAAAIDMNDRFYDKYGRLINDEIKFSTIHSFSYKIIRHYYYINNIKYGLIEGTKTRHNKRYILQRIYRSINKSSINDDKLDELSNSISFVKNLMIDIRDFKDHKFQTRNFDKIFMTYEEYKKSNEHNMILLDFDDMLIEANNILDKNPNLLKKYQQQYKYIMIDEGQDTSLIQNRIAEKIALPSNNLFIVCDDDQSIYRFRGAEPGYLLDFQKRYPDANVIFMERNYRSGKGIVDISNRLINNNSMRYPKKMFTKNCHKEPVKIVKLSTEKEQLDYIIGLIKLNNIVGDTAILYRNNLSGIGLAQRLYEENISFYMKDYHRNFFSHWVLNDILNFVRFSYDDTSLPLLEAIYTKFFSYISKKELEYLRSQDQTKSVFDNIVKFPGMKEFKKRNMATFKRDFSSLRIKRPLDAIRAIRYDFRYEERLGSYAEIAGYSIDNLKYILNTLEEISRGTNTMQEFVDKLNNLKRAMHESRENRYGDTITLSTLHSSKGLEFKRVFMIDLIEGQIPTKDSIKLDSMGDSTALEEERRLWYVGMTRAKESLELLTVEYKNKEDVQPSRFIKEIEEFLSNNKGEKGTNIPLKPTSIVRHKKFGLGIVKAIKDRLITIDFDEKGEKQLSVDTCIKKNLLEVVKINA
ncbi:ATP-dependent helicase [Wukongibacter sp. M2B1]|uniref:ATP-dependent helicase n=1 Tax=Wukongibacter sp. M2B1 TaxID=3088895 RepID=UPI003D78E3D0